MGWLFGKKKVPKVPFPEGQVVDETALRFPGSIHSERVIEPEDLKEAVGIRGPLPPSFEELEQEENPRKTAATFPRRGSAEPSFRRSSEPLFVKVEVYQRILGEIDGIKKTMSGLSEINRELENSEYNEENNFDTLRRELKVIHDRLLQMDKTLFKTQSD